MEELDFSTVFRRGDIYVTSHSDTGAVELVFEGFSRSLKMTPALAEEVSASLVFHAEYARRLRKGVID